MPTNTAYLTPDLVIICYRGSRITFTMQLKDGTGALVSLTGYALDFSWRTGSRLSPGPVALSLRTTGSPAYITISGTTATVDVPAAVSGGVAAGSYYAELIATPPAADPVFTGWATFQHEVTAIGTP